MVNNEASDYGSLIREIFHGSRSKQIPKGQIIQYQGDKVSDVYYLRSGYVKAYLILDSGETRTMFMLGRDDVFPVSFSMAVNWTEDSVKYFYEALSDVDACLLSPAELKQKADKNPHYITAILSYMAHTNESVIELLESTKSKSATDKVAAALKYIVKRLSKSDHNGTYTLGLKLSHQEIADLCGLTRETVSVAVKTLEKAGLAKVKGTAITIKDGS